MPSQLIVFICCLLFAKPLVDIQSTKPQLIIWNIGQGQWITYVEPLRCIHFDSGGEFPPKLDLLKSLCGHKMNAHFLSHHDWDHRNYLYMLQKQFPKLCRFENPEDKSPKKREHYEALTRCEWSELPFAVIYPVKKNNASSANATSQVALLNEQILIPGDSLIKQETHWAQAKLRKAKVLIAGHHGSKTSNGSYLLSQLTGVTMAISSSRKAKYGHPHWQVQKRFQDFKIPILRTEVWGTVILDLPR